MSASRPPDDTPTRLIEDELYDYYLKDAGQQACLHGIVADAIDDIKELRAEVSRLQQEHAKAIYLEELLKEDHAKALEENALLRRSLEMLTKQLDEKDAEIVELKDAVYRLCPPRS